MNKNIYQILSKNFLQNINLLYFIEQYPINYSSVYGNSILLKGKSDRDWVMISSSNQNELENLLLENIVGSKCFAYLEDWMIPFVTKGKKIKWILSTVQYYLPDNINLPDKTYNTKSLRTEDAEFIVKNSDYGEYLSVKYIAERIKKAPSSGIFKNNKLVAWILTHDDMAIGSLHVLPEYRKQGFGRSLFIDMILKIRNIQKIPFAYIVPNNKKSISLTQKLGFIKHKNINWLEIE